MMDDQPKPIFGALTVYRERGAHLRRLEQFNESKASYDEAYKSFPEDVRTLIGRSQAATFAVRPQEAYADAELALKLKPSDLNARNMQAKALQTMTEFEKSVVMNYRGYSKRRQPPYFLEGINEFTEIIQDCIGSNAGNVMVDFLPIIIQEEQKSTRGKGESEQATHLSRISLHAKRRPTQLEVRKHQILQRVLALKYLGPLAYDKFFLQNLIHDPRLKSANSRGNLTLKGIVNNAYNTLEMRQDILRAQRPYYTIKQAEKSQSKHQNAFEKEKKKKERQIGKKTADIQLKKIVASVRANRVMDVLSKAEKLQMFLNSKTPRNLPEKDNYIDSLYKYVGEAYFNQHRLSYTLSERSNRRRIAFLMGLPVGRSKSYDSVIANYPYKYVDVKEATAKAKATLDMCENATMKCWLMYELSRLLCEQKNYALSKFYAKRCQYEAQKIDSVVWWLNGCFALLSGDMQQGNFNDVRTEVEQAYEYTKRMQDAEIIQAFLAKCVQMLAEAKPPDEVNEVRQREKHILKVMVEPEKVTAEVMFKRMSNVPLGRRFSVPPIKKDEDEKRSERKSRKQKRLSFIPGPERELPRMPKSRVPGFQLFDL